MTERPATEQEIAVPKTTSGYWDGLHAARIRLRLPSRLVAPTRDAMDLLAQYVSQDSRVLEIGFAPGKLLAWLASEKGSQVAGLDYSSEGVTSAERLFSALGLKGDLRCEELATNSFKPASFQVVYSIGLVEHFENPRPVVEQHLRLVSVPGVLLIVIPDYSGVYGRLQQLFDPANLAIHNLGIMSQEGLRRCAPTRRDLTIRTFRFGRLNPWLVSWRARLPWLFARIVELSLNLVGLLQPQNVGFPRSLIVLEIRKNDGDTGVD